MMTIDDSPYYGALVFDTIRKLENREEVPAHILREDGRLYWICKFDKRSTGVRDFTGQLHITGAVTFASDFGPKQEKEGKSGGEGSTKEEYLAF